MKLSILIPARNEEFLKNTVEDILKNIEDETEIIVGLDGEWSNPALPQDPRLTIVYYPKSIGQRAMTNRLCELSKAKYVMKVDAHCAFDKGFDKKLIEDMQDNWTIVPVMKNLHAFDWKCKKCGNQWYQSPTPTECRMRDPKDKKGWVVNKSCDGKEFEKVIIFEPNDSPSNTSYRVNSQLEFKYFGEYKAKQKGDLVETMSLQGSCFMMTREKYKELNICDESWGSWGGQGAEVALKTWLSGGSVICDKRTWYAHLFRTQGGDFGFPYPNPGNEQKKAKDCLRDIFLNDKWDKAIRPLSWLIKKFNPPEWNIESKGIVFYTDNQLNLKIAHKVQKQLKKINLPIISVSLKPMNFGNNRVFKEMRGRLTMFKQILAGLEASTADTIFLCEHDILYNQSHFDFTPPRKDKFYFNINVWKVDWETHKAITYDDLAQNSGLCGNRMLLIEWAKERIKKFETKFDHHYEPQVNREYWRSEKPLIDIRHSNNLTANRWSIDKFRTKPTGWKEGKIDIK